MIVFFIRCDELFYTFDWRKYEAWHRNKLLTCFRTRCQHWLGQDLNGCFYSVSRGPFFCYQWKFYPLFVDNTRLLSRHGDKNVRTLPCPHLTKSVMGFVLLLLYSCRLINFLHHSVRGTTPKSQSPVWKMRIVLNYCPIEL